MKEDNFDKRDPVNTPIHQEDTVNEAVSSEACEQDLHAVESEKNSENLNTGRYISENETYGGKPTTLKGRLENFWYHYKWHTVVGIALLLISAILFTQMATTPEYDVNMIYAGGYTFSRQEKDGEVPYLTALKSLARVVYDYNGDGEVNINLNDHYVLTAEEITALKESGNTDINEYRIKTDFEDLNTNIIADGYHVILMSEAVYRDYSERYTEELFVNLTSYAPEGAELSYADSTCRAVYLKDLPFGDTPELCNLPDDTVLCLRNKTVSLTFGGSKDEDFKRSEEIIRRILSFR